MDLGEPPLNIKNPLESKLHEIQILSSRTDRIIIIVIIIGSSSSSRYTLTLDRAPSRPAGTRAGHRVCMRVSV